MVLKYIRKGTEEKTKEPLVEFETDEFGGNDRFYAFELKDACMCGARLYFQLEDNVIFCQYGCCMFEGDWEINHNFDKDTLQHLKSIREQ